MLIGPSNVWNWSDLDGIYVASAHLDNKNISSHTHFILGISHLVEAYSHKRLEYSLWGCPALDWLRQKLAGHIKFSVDSIPLSPTCCLTLSLDVIVLLLNPLYFSTWQWILQLPPCDHTWMLEEHVIVQA